MKHQPQLSNPDVVNKIIFIDGHESELRSVGKAPDRRPQSMFETISLLLSIACISSVLWASANFDDREIGRKPANIQQMGFAYNSDENPTWIQDYVRYHNSPNTDDTRYLVWICTASEECGGIGDRARGIVGSFYLALASGRKLLIVNPDPVDLLDVVRPAAIDWATDAVAISEQASWDLDWMSILDPDISSIMSQELSIHKTIRIRTNVQNLWLKIMNDPVFAESFQMRQVPHGIWSEWFGAEILFNWAWNVLMTPTTALLSDIELLKQQVGLGSGPFNLVHIRTGLHWSDGGRHGSDHDFRRFLSCLDVVSGITGDYPVYIASDDIETKARFQRLSSHRIVYDNMTDPFHVDRSSVNDDAALQRNRRAWSEFHLIKTSHCPVISMSGFSQWPVIVSRHPTTGARCFARFDVCDPDKVTRSKYEFISTTA